MTVAALLRYQGALLLRSQHWIGPLVVYAAFVAVGVRSGDPALDALGYTAAGLVPLSAWLVRVCVTAEPPAARAVSAAAAGPVRVHAAALLTALAGTLLAGAAGAVYALLAGDLGYQPAAGTALAGAVALAVCALTGTAVGAVCSRPLLRGRGRSFLAAGVGSLLAWVVAFSPARSAVSALVGAARADSAPLPLGALAGAVLLAGAAGGVACLAGMRRG
ncbi:ABC transporter [Streptomyces sp. WAC07149]|uniref:ABC transporter n=1 Tax=Streptomyces sp. WAC07149 TaxID=2487425 RepID=UPI000F76BAD0|nr:ABC transporter [Streptomyces sp. WAC07149]RST05887.1 ABC transporter [Streptomyces sp. WAC07149]